MTKIPGYYDIDCGSDVYLVKVAADNGNFHYVRIHADVAKTVDFSGGIRGIDTIVLDKCFKVGRIIWPDDTGAIQRLYINGAESLTHLDISELKNLQQLYVVNCPSLSHISGMAADLKELCLHQVRINDLNLSGITELEKLNIITTAAKLRVNATHREHLMYVFLKVRAPGKDTGNISCILSHNPSLHQVYISAASHPVKLDVRDSHGIHQIVVSGAMKSTITGLDDCKKLGYLCASKETILLKDAPQSKIDYRLAKNQAGHLPSFAKVKDDIIKERDKFISYVTNYEPGIDDKEIVIQERTSRRDIGQRGNVRIELLSADINQVKVIDENNLRNAARITVFGKHHFLQSPAYMMYYIRDSVNWTRPDRIIQNARYSENPRVIQQWLDNADQRLFNPLLITPQLIRNHPLFKKFIIVYAKKTPMFTYRGIKYVRNSNSVVLLAGNLAELKAAVPGIANSISTISFDSLEADSDHLHTDEFIQLMRETHEMCNVSMQQTAQTTARINTTATQFALAYNAALPASSNIEEINPAPNAARPRSELPEQTPISGQSAVPDTQTAIDSSAKSPPEMKGKFIPQHPLKHDPVTEQNLIAGRSKTPQGQHIIDASAEYTDEPAPENLHGTYAPQHQVKHEPYDNQEAIDAAAHYTALPPYDENVLIQAEASRAAELQSADKLIPDDVPEQQFINVDKTATEPLKSAALLHPDDTPPQTLLAANRLFFETKTQAVSQTDTRLFDAAKNLAVVMRDMLNAVEVNSDSHSKKSVELAQANSLMKSAEKELAQAKHHIKLNEQQKSDNKMRESMLEASREMISALQALYIACKLNTITPEPEQQTPRNDLSRE